MVFVVKGLLTYTKGMIMDVVPISGVEVVQESVGPGRWLSEASLWTVWENHGQLSSTSDAGKDDGTLLGIEVEPFLKVMKSHENSLIEAAVYAKSFVDVLNE